MQIKKENLIKAYQEGCDDVKKVLIALFPEVEFVKPRKFKIDDVVSLNATIVKTDDSNDFPYRISIMGHDDFSYVWVSEEQLTKLKKK